MLIYIRHDYGVERHINLGLIVKEYFLSENTYQNFIYKKTASYKHIIY